MKRGRSRRSCGWILAGLLCLQCSGLERDNPFDSIRTVPEERAALSLSIPLSKSLTGVVVRVVALLEGPDMVPVEKELALSPLGPATGTIGAIPPGTQRTLTIEGYDQDGNLIFTGRKEGITIAAGDTAEVEILLRRVTPPPEGETAGAEEESSSGTEDQSAPSEESTESPTGKEEEATGEGESGMEEGGLSGEETSSGGQEAGGTEEAVSDTSAAAEGAPVEGGGEG